MKLTHDDLHKIIHDSEISKLTYTEISLKMGIHKTTVSRFLKKEIHKKFWEDYLAPIACGRKKCDHLNPQKYDGKKLLILTCAQSNTYVHEELLASLEVLKSRYDGEILVGTCSYNKSGYDSEWFDPAIVPYINNEPLILAEGLQWRGELNILPTAAKPMTRFKAYTGLDSFVLPHVKAQSQGLTVRKVDNPKLSYTTGAITKRNYIQKTAGQVASFNHIFGALVIEIDKDGTWFAFRVNAESETGNFYLHDTYYTPDGYTTGHNSKVINAPDAHVANMSKEVADLIYHGGVLDEFKPEYFVWNDTYNGTSNNRHEKDCPLAKIKNLRSRTQSVQEEIKLTSDFVYKAQRDFCTHLITYANHDTITERWAKDEDWKKTDAINIVYLLECQLLLAKNAAEGNKAYYLFEDLMKNANPGLTAKFLRCDESFEILGIELASHGHVGNGGARGSNNSFLVIGVKTNKGHDHTACEIDGVMSAGVSELDQGYNMGGTSWSVTFINTYQNGKRSLYTTRNGKYKAEYHFIKGEWV